MAKSIGIDLGTTNSVMAFVDGHKPQIIPNRENKLRTRSVVGIRSLVLEGGVPRKEILVGDDAMDNWEFSPADTIISVKRLMGRPYYDKHVQEFRESVLYDIRKPSIGTKDSVVVMLDGVEHSPQEISQRILEKLKSDAEHHLMDDVTHAVITVPAYFTDTQKAATREAARLAGLGVIRILEEPTAAAMAFGVSSEDPITVLVYDLGGGTFDVSLLIIAAGSFTSIALGGDMWLGGDNFDALLEEYVLEYISREYHLDPPFDSRFMAELKNKVREAKERLSLHPRERIYLPGHLKDRDGKLLNIGLDITKEAYECLIRPLVGRYRACTCKEAKRGRYQGAPCKVANRVDADVCEECGESLANSAPQDGRAMAIVKSALADQKLTPEEVDLVLMAGDASRTPLIQETLAEVFGKDKVVHGSHPKESVAMGAAILAARLPREWICECGHRNDAAQPKCGGCPARLGAKEMGDSLDQPISAFYYGTESARDKFNVFIKKGDPYPSAAPTTQTFLTQTAGQKILIIPYYAGFNLDRASANEKQGEAFVILPPDLDRNTRLHVQLSLDRNGVVELSAYLESGADLNPWIMRGAADAQIVEVIQDVERILAVKRPLISPDRLHLFGRQLAAILTDLSGNSVDAARERAFEYRDDAIRFGEVKNESLEEMGVRLIGYTEYLLDDYGWALSAAKADRLRRDVDAVTRALELGDTRALKTAVDMLDRETDSLPEEILVIRRIDTLVRRRLELIHPGKAREITQRLAAIIDAWRLNVEVALPQLDALKDEAWNAVRSAPQPDVQVCDICKERLLHPGERYCINNHDLWLPKQ